MPDLDALEQAGITYANNNGGLLVAIAELLGTN
ncbi:hypothetical protein X754_22980 [Mesorhizobium sp. LNJC403B00]|nr:hypothetical protein X754_22980 [Mesorhizobium sp. LNJC403B00]